MSIQIPVIEVFLREVGLGFGYRYTLASIKAADQVNDIRKLLQELKRLAVTQNNLSDRRNWKIDLEPAGQSPRFTVALRAMISQTSTQEGPFGDYEGADQDQEEAKTEARELDATSPACSC